MFQNFQTMNREAIAAVAGEALALLPTGSMEQHGPHLAVSVDTLLVTEVIRRAEPKITMERPIVLLPPMHFGASHHWLAFTGVLSLSSDTYIRAIRDLCECLILQGFSRILILNGHGGNDAPNRVVGMDLINDHDIQIETLSYWNLDPEGWSELWPEGFAGIPGHSGDFETSMMLSAFPDLVQPDWRELIDQAAASVREAGPPSGMGLADPASRPNRTGFTDESRNASAEMGETLVDHLSTALAQFIERKFGSSS